MLAEPRLLDLPGPSRRIRVEPLRLPDPAVAPEPVPAAPPPPERPEPVPERDPGPAPRRDPVPA